MEQVLRHPAIGSFDDVSTLHDPDAAELRQRLSEFLDGCGPADLALVYLSGHGTRLRYSTGEFYFVTRDTDADRLAETGVSAGFVNEQLEACRAPQKVTIIDACESGGFAVGLRTQDAKGTAPGQRQAAPLQSRGVYVLSSSGAGEASYSGPVVDGVSQPSLFTGEIVQALENGTADSDGDGKVSVDDIFHHVSGRISSQEQRTRQVPVYSAIGVNSKIIIANVVAGGSIRLEAMPPAPIRSAGLKAEDGVARDQGRGDRWQQLIDYYRGCLQAEAQGAPLLRLSEEGDRFLVLSGRERILSGGTDVNDQVELDEKTAEWSRKVTESEDELWAGYPAVLLYESADRTGRQARFAPLITRRVEVIDGGAGLRLAPVGAAEPHPGLAQEWLGDEQAQHLAATYYASWHAGGYAQMSKDIRELLRTEFELPEVEELRPEFLAAGMDLRTPTAGARNVAVLYRVPRRDAIIGKLLDDLADVRGQVAQIENTALSGFLESAATECRSATSPTLVTPLPCNDAQQAVIADAMTVPLTVATGPPGSGKSQLVANAVATAVTAGQSVLVASTNNTAVDEVWQRCRGLFPGLMIRTGSRTGRINYEENETVELTELSGLGLAAPNIPTAQAKLNSETRRVHEARTQLGAVAELERDLLAAVRRRARLAEALQVSACELADRFGDDERLLRWQRRAHRCAKSRILGRWRRSRLLRSLGITVEPTPDACRTITEFAAVERDWRVLRLRVAEVPDDSVLAARATEAEAAVNVAALALVEAVVRTNATRGRQRILNLLRTKKEPGSDWGAVTRVLSRASPDTPAAVAGWAISSLSARRFPPNPALFDLVIVDEASQCSVPQVLPLLFRARRALIIGDPMQLQHIAEISPEREAHERRPTGLSADWLEEHQLSYRRHSAFAAAERAKGGSRLLNEHYRCHPQIAEFVNRQFYGGQLTILTETRNQKRLERDPIVWSSLEGKPSRPGQRGSWINTAEVQKVNDCVNYILREVPDASVGVVTPYKAQADRIANSWQDESRVRVGTVHTFQGGERDVMVFDLVAGPAMPGGSIAWLEAERNLWNVAISRARSHLIVVGNRSFWARRRGVGAELAEIDAASDLMEKGDPLLDRLYEWLCRSKYSEVL